MASAILEEKFRKNIHSIDSSLLSSALNRYSLFHMNIWKHLGELRKRLLICIYVLLGGLPVGAFLVNPVIAWLSKLGGEFWCLCSRWKRLRGAQRLEIAVGVSFLLGLLAILLYQTWGVLWRQD